MKDRTSLTTDRFRPHPQDRMIQHTQTLQESLERSIGTSLDTYVAEPQGYFNPHVFYDLLEDTIIKATKPMNESDHDKRHERTLEGYLTAKRIYDDLILDSEIFELETPLGWISVTTQPRTNTFTKAPEPMSTFYDKYIERLLAYTLENQTAPEVDLKYKNLGIHNEEIVLFDTNTVIPNGGLSEAYYFTHRLLEDRIIDDPSKYERVFDATTGPITYLYHPLKLRTSTRF